MSKIYVGRKCSCEGLVHQCAAVETFESSAAVKLASETSGSEARVEGVPTKLITSSVDLHCLSFHSSQRELHEFMTKLRGKQS